MVGVYLGVQGALLYQICFHSSVEAIKYSGLHISSHMGGLEGMDALTVFELTFTKDTFMKHWMDVQA